MALIDLIRRELVESRGHVGAGFDPPAEPQYSECRRADRPLEAILDEIARIAEPGATVTMFDPRRFSIADGIANVRLGAAIPVAMDSPLTVSADPSPHAWVVELAGEPVACFVDVDGVVAMITPLVRGMRVAPDLTHGEPAAALRERWGAALVEDPATGGRRVWHRDHPATIVRQDPDGHVRSVVVWSREHLIRLWLAWDLGIEPEFLRFVVTRERRIVHDTGDPTAALRRDADRPGFVLRPSPPRTGAYDLTRLPPGPCELTITPCDPDSRIAPVSLVVRTGELDVQVPLRYR